MKNIVIALAIVAATFAAARPADAGTTIGYVCEVTVNAPSTARGTGGYLVVKLTPDPDCTGNLSFGYVCTEGATSSDCDLAALQSAGTLNTIANLLSTALAQERRVRAYWVSQAAVWRSVTMLAN